MQEKHDRKENFIEMFDKLINENIKTASAKEHLQAEQQSTYAEKDIRSDTAALSAQPRPAVPPARRNIPRRFIRLPRLPRGVLPPIPQPLPPIIRPSDSRSILLAAHIYRQIRSLKETYNSLMELNRRQHVNEIERMLQELNRIEAAALDIYQTLSGSETNPYTRNIYDRLPNNYCLALRVTFNRVSGLYDDLLALQRLVNVPQIDRQIVIMASVLQRQMSTFNTLLIDCVL